jgi:hypothetical protein
LIVAVSLVVAESLDATLAFGRGFGLFVHILYDPALQQERRVGHITSSSFGWSKPSQGIIRVMARDQGTRQPTASPFGASVDNTGEFFGWEGQARCAALWLPGIGWLGWRRGERA